MQMGFKVQLADFRFGQGFGSDFDWEGGLKMAVRCWVVLGRKSGWAKVDSEDELKLFALVIVEVCAGLVMLLV